MATQHRAGRDRFASWFRLSGWSAGDVGKAVGAAALGCAIIALVLVVVDLRHSSPGSHQPPAAGQPAAVEGTTTAASSSAHHRSATPSQSATSTSVATSGATTPSQSPHGSTPRSSSHPVSSPPSSPSSTSHPTTTKPTPTPTPVQQVISIPLPSDTLSVAVSMPAGWVITSVSSGVKVSGDGVHSGKWTAVSSPFAVTVAGMSNSSGTMQVTIVTTLHGTINRSYQLG